MDPTHVLGRRVVGYVIDLLLLGLVFSAVFYALATHTTGAVHLTGTNVNVELGNDTYYLRGDDATGFFAIELLIALLYTGVIQGLTGATIGKLVCGIRVMREDGRRPGLWRGLVRWALLIVDAFPYPTMLVGFIVALSNDRRQRVGDLAAGTYVVRASAAGRPLRAEPSAAAFAVAAQPPVAGLAADQTTPATATPAPPIWRAESATGARAGPPPVKAEPAAPAATEAAEADTASMAPIAPTRPERAPTAPVAPGAAPSQEAAPPADEPAIPAPPPPPVPPPLPPANWYPDPSGKARLRYWDGSRWTDHTAH